MQATQPLRTYQTVRAAAAGFVATAIIIAAIVLASLLPSLGGGAGAGSNAGSGFVRLPHDSYSAPAQVPLKLDPDARNGGAGIHANVPN